MVGEVGWGWGGGRSVALTDIDFILKRTFFFNLAKRMLDKVMISI